MKVFQPYIWQTRGSGGHCLCDLYGAARLHLVLKTWDSKRRCDIHSRLLWSWWFFIHASHL